MSLTLTPGAVPLAVLEKIYRAGETVALDPACRDRMERAAARIDEIAAGREAVYGINTGFGKLASVRIPPTDVATLQRNLILSHCCGVGAPLGADIVRLVMALKLVSLGRGASGVRMQTVELLQDMLARGVLPVIPEKGLRRRLRRPRAARPHGRRDDRRGRGVPSTASACRPPPRSNGPGWSPSCSPPRRAWR